MPSATRVTWLRRPIVGALLVAPLVVGCGEVAEQATETAIEQGSGGDVDLELDDDGGSLSMSTEDGEMRMEVDEDGTSGMVVESEDGSFSSVSGNEIPDDFPDSVYLPSGLQVETAVRQEADGTLSFVVSGVVDGDAEDVINQVLDAYDDEPSGGYSSGSSHGATYQDIDGWDLSYAANARDGATLVNVIAESAQ